MDIPGNQRYSSRLGRLPIQTTYLGTPHHEAVLIQTPYQTPHLRSLGRVYVTLPLSFLAVEYSEG